MSDRDLLMIPGPTNVDPRVLRSLARPTLSHVSPTFAQILKETLQDLSTIFMSKGLILPIAGSGTLGAEVALANVIERGDSVLAISGGYFGDRLAEIAATLGAVVDKIDVPWGSAVKPELVKERLAAKRYKALLVVHVDTSTGVANPIRELGDLTKSNGALYVVDSVCSMGGMEVRVDDWGIDICFTGSQKALGVPPGLAVVSFSDKAQSARRARKSPIGTYYGDLERWRPVLTDPTKYFATHAVNMVYALHESCEMIVTEGLEQRFSRHARIARAFRAAMRDLKVKPLCIEEESATTLTVALYPESVNDAKFRTCLAKSHGIVVAGGLGELAGRGFRVGHMGNVNYSDIMSTISAIEAALAEQISQFEPGRGIAAAIKNL